MVLARIKCGLLGHQWSQRIAVPGEFCNIVVLVCDRCEKGEEALLGVVHAHANYIADKAG
jgi:hypothetical protein